MLKNVEVKERLEEMVKAQKADNSVSRALNNNEKELKKIRTNINNLNKELTRIADEIGRLKTEKTKTPIYKVNIITNKMKELSNMKKRYKDILEELKNLNNAYDIKLTENSDICDLINAQYTIYQENEIMVKAVEKISVECTEIATGFCTDYMMKINIYMDSIFSISKNTRLKAPNHNDLIKLLEIIKNHKKQNNNEENKKTYRKYNKKSNINEVKTDSEISNTTKRYSTTNRKNNKNNYLNDYDQKNEIKDNSSNRRKNTIVAS